MTDDLFALVIRPDIQTPPERVPFKRDDLLAVLYRLIEDSDRQGVEATARIASPWGEFVAYVGGHSLLTPDAPSNDAALSLVRAFGYMAPDLRGTAVIVGSAEPDGWNGSCPVGLADRFDQVHAIQRAQANRA